MLDSFNKWAPGTAAGLTWVQLDNYSKAMFKLLGGFDERDGLDDNKADSDLYIEYRKTTSDSPPIGYAQFRRELQNGTRKR